MGKNKSLKTRNRMKQKNLNGYPIGSSTTQRITVPSDFFLAMPHGLPDRSFLTTD